MGFYYGSNEPPPDKEQGSFKDALLITFAVFRILALPLGVMVAGGGYIVFVFYLFSVSPFAGYGGLSLIVVALGALWLWEKSHPPALEE